MKQIQPLQIWVNGSIKEAIYFYLQINFDNLTDTAVFYYSLNDSEKNRVADGNLTISGQDYSDWSAESDANEWAYTWAAGQLNLTIV